MGKIHGRKSAFNWTKINSVWLIVEKSRIFLKTKLVSRPKLLMPVLKWPSGLDWRSAVKTTWLLFKSTPTRLGTNGRGGGWWWVKGVATSILPHWTCVQLACGQPVIDRCLSTYAFTSVFWQSHNLPKMPPKLAKMLFFGLFWPFLRPKWTNLNFWKVLECAQLPLKNTKTKNQKNYRH